MKYLVFVPMTIFLLAGYVATGFCLEEYAEKTGHDCEYCHVDPSGGAELTDIGKGFRLSLTGAETAGEQRRVDDKQPGAGKIFKLLIGFLHMFTAIFWFGTILYVHLVLKPAYASGGLPPNEVRVGLVSIVVMAVTGIILTYYRVPSWEFLLTTRFGILLLIKIALFLFLVLSALIVVLFIGPKLRKKKQSAAVAVGDMTISQLAHFDGKEGRPALVGFEGDIYDVTDSRMWKNGTHMMKHQAGEDLTVSLAQAPHGAEPIIERMVRVGRLLPEQMESAGLRPKHVFYFMAYANLIVVIGIIFIISLWRWW